jgi:hypothetical protein
VPYLTSCNLPLSLRETLPPAEINFLLANPFAALAMLKPKEPGHFIFVFYSEQERQVFADGPHRNKISFRSWV